MKSFVVRPVGLVGVLLIAAGCGSSGDGGPGPADGSVDLSDTSAPGTDAPTATPEAGGGGDDATTSDDAGTCGDGVVEGTEGCDDGAKNGTTGDPCTIGCAWVCIKGDPTQGDPLCNGGVKNPCLGTATCQADHTCLPGTPLAEGASCGTGLICSGGTCNAAVCGDGIVTLPEECDDGAKNGTASDGCDKNCKFVCVSTDPTRNCTPADPCAGQGTCVAATHVCAAGTTLGNGTICGGEATDGGAPDGGAIEVCKTGACVAGYCGDGVIDESPPEQCDFGAGNGPGTGCEINCTLSCTKSPNSCPQPTDSCAGPSTCTSVTVTGDNGQKCVVGPSLPDTTPCGAGNNGKCSGGVCVVTTCGDGTLQSGEDCDWGTAKNIAGSGCEPTCKFSCTKSPDSCANDDLCTASPMTCQTVSQPGTDAGADVGQKCQAAAQITNCGVCDTATAGEFVCTGDKCATSICGDGCVDPRDLTGTPATGEQCEPPNTATCDKFCHTIAAAVCGNGVREAGEQCDDGNTTNLDGCSYESATNNCKFEQDHRVNSVSINGTTDSFCANNALGKGALANNFLTLGVLNGDLKTGVQAGTTTIAFTFENITDLAGVQANPGLQLGSLSGTPVTPGTTYDGTADTDWWYTTTGTTINANRDALSVLPATLSGTKLAASGTIDLAVALTAAATTLHVTSTKIAATVGTSNAPTKSTGAPPGHLASENLDPALTSFATMTNGALCGNLSTASLANVPVPTTLVGTFCTQKFAATNSLLDVLVVGCNAIITINPTQPDQIDPAAPVQGAGGLYTLVATGNTVTACTDKGAAHTYTKPSAGFTACLTAAAYSSYFNFTSDRVIMK